MKLLIIALMFCPLSNAMQDPKNMSREMLEKALEAAKQTIAQQETTIATQSFALDFMMRLHYGTPLEQVSARAELQKFKQMYYINRYARIGK